MVRAALGRKSVKVSDSVVYNVTNATKNTPVPGVFVFGGATEEEVESMLQLEFETKDSFEFDVYTRRTDEEWELYVEDQLSLTKTLGELFGANPTKDPDDTWVKTWYIGSVFNLHPSGKYYMPFACSNVMGCIDCCHDGRVVNGATDPRKFAFLKGLHDQTTSYCSEHGFLGMGNVLSGIRNAMNSCAEDIVCPVCNGTGSREASEDESWREALEKLLGEAGCWLISGEGDPCDLFICCHAEEEEEDDVQESV